MDIDVERVLHAVTERLRRSQGTWEIEDLTDAKGPASSHLGLISRV
jgi:hypothetical protein